MRTLIGSCAVLCLLSTDLLAQQISAATYRKIEAARKLVDQKNEQEAVRVLREYAPKVHDNATDIVQVKQFIASLLIKLDDVEGAIAEIESIIDRPEIKAQLGDTFGKLLIMQDDFARGIRYLSEWMAVQEDIPADPYYTRGYAYYASKKYSQAEQDLEIAVSLMDPVPDSWYALLLATYFYLEKFNKAEGLAKMLTNSQPNNAENWRRLARIYVEREDYSKALAALMTAYHNHLLEERDYEQLVSMHAYLGMPENSARLLETWIENSDRKNKDFKTLKQLANYWLIARERDKARSIYEQAAALDTTGKTYNMLANLYFNDEQWEQAEKYCSLAIGKGGLEDVHNTQLIGGIAAVKAGNFSTARELLRKAEKAEKQSRTARYWLNEIKKELAKQESS